MKRVVLTKRAQIGQLVTQLQETEPVQTKVDQALDYIEAQQKELSDMLDSYERQVDQEYQGGLGSMHAGGDVRGGGVGADQQREKACVPTSHLSVEMNGQ